MFTESDQSHIVRLYDVSGTQEVGTSAFYFRPPLGEAVILDVVTSVPDVTVTDIEVPSGVDHITVPSNYAGFLIGRVATILRREDRLLQHVIPGTSND
jgi:hypothetical protein